MKKTKIKEVIVVEGRDDTRAVKQALDAETIETHGFGISGDTWSLIQKAYDEQGIIIFTDPDHAGEEIRRRLIDRFPDAGEAFLSRADARDGSDIGIENASPEAIRAAISKVCTSERSAGGSEFSMRDMTEYGMSGCEGAEARRRFIGKELGIGYGNSSAFLRKLNRYGITRDDLDRACDRMCAERRDL